MVLFQTPPAGSPRSADRDRPSTGRRFNFPSRFGRGLSGSATPGSGTVLDRSKEPCRARGNCPPYSRLRRRRTAMHFGRTPVCKASSGQAPPHQRCIVIRGSTSQDWMSRWPLVGLALLAVIALGFPTQNFATATQTVVHSFQPTYNGNFSVQGA